jgi:hypothetical protein
VSNPLVGLRLPKPAVRKLNDLAARTVRNKSDVVTILLLGADVTADGGLRFTPPCAQASASAGEAVS